MDNGSKLPPPGWIGRASRIEAEQKLYNQPVGTFVLRESDDLTGRITKVLKRANREVLHSYLLTVVENQGKITDRWIIHTDQGWTLYQDNPNLHDQKYYCFHPTLNSLLESIRNIARRALDK